MSMIGSLREGEVSKFLVLFYIVGVTGLLIPFTYSFFVKLIPYTLLLNFVLLLYFHQERISYKTIAIFFVIMVLGLLVEMVGVNTGIIFGEYAYGASLGIAIMKTPIIIGLNWLLITYLTASVFEKLKTSVYVKILLGSVAMLLFDLVLEQVAPKLEMWTWRNNIVPLRNYFMWFVLAAGFHSLIKFSGIRLVNPLSAVVLSSQFLFFVVLFLFLR